MGEEIYQHDEFTTETSATYTVQWNIIGEKMLGTKRLSKLLIIIAIFISLGFTLPS